MEDEGEIIPRTLPATRLFVVWQFLCAFYPLVTHLHIIMMSFSHCCSLRTIFLVSVLLPVGALAQAKPVNHSSEPISGQKQLAAYLERRVSGIENQARVDPTCLADYIDTKNDLTEQDLAEAWQAYRVDRQRELRYMLGIEPLPPRTPLQTTVTGTVEGDDFTVENLHFQSSPGLYVTGNLYLPKGEGKHPGILYACGHGRVKIDGVSYGNKVHYQHHGVWFARMGYVCLIIDTIQLGEIEGVHHGTYRRGRWWWPARGYTPAGVEAWNGMRAMDLLCAHPRVDAERIGMTGRSGGGAYSWWVSALDDRVKVSVPVAGIASLRNHVIDGCVEGHCDCMYMVNRFGWSFDEISSLVAPRPLMLANTDSDRIFPLDGVMQVHKHTREVYRMLGAASNFGLCIVDGGHKDTQSIQVPAFQWFERHLKGKSTEATFSVTAEKLFKPQQLKVFRGGIPADEIVTRIDEEFVSQQLPEIPKSKAEWKKIKGGLKRKLRNECFAAWPIVVPDRSLNPEEKRRAHRKMLIRLETGKGSDRRLDAVFNWDLFNSVSRPTLPEGSTNKLENVRVVILSKETWKPDGKEGEHRLRNDCITLFFAPRGVGPTDWRAEGKKETHIRRRFHLLGETLDSMQVFDIRQKLLSTRAVHPDKKITLEASGRMGVNALIATLFAEGVVDDIDVGEIPSSFKDGGPIYLNVLRFMDIPHLLAMIDLPGRMETMEPATLEFKTQARRRQATMQ